MDINTFVKIARYTLIGSGVVLTGVALYCEKKQKEMDNVVLGPNRIMRNGIVFTIVDVPDDIINEALNSED